MKKLNRLQFEKSPYLLQHATNPVDWYPWGDAAFEAAKNLNRPLLISIGYAACHWCHVMEQESFENDAVADFMNQHFINVKVDREEHPEVDHFYMDALQAISGQGGWPLNMFATPDKQPFYGGTYFPPKAMYGRISWLELLEAVSKTWQDKNDETFAKAAQLTQHLQNASLLSTKQEPFLNKDDISLMDENLLKEADTVWGGFGNAPKFPNFMAIQFLMEHAYFSKNEVAQHHATLTLDKIIAGGIYDQIGGGISRYATDKKWLVPHFEKMLYDNALFIITLADAYRVTQNINYKKSIEETIAFCNRELRNSDGLFYSALDADSEGVEGLYYTWTWEEWTKALPDAHPAVQDYWGVNQKGNWENTNILYRAVEEQEILKKYNLNQEAWHTILNTHKNTLLEVRNKRVRPLTDDKSILSWNAMMNTALVKAGIALCDESYIQQAIVLAKLMMQQFNAADDTLFRVHKDKAYIAAKLEDYAYWIAALIALGAASGDEHYFIEAKRLSDILEQDFLEDTNTFYYFTSKAQQDIPVRKIELYDGAMPSANSVMMHSLWILGNLFEETKWLERAKQMMCQINTTMLRYPSSFSYWCVFAQRYCFGMVQLVLAGEDALEQERLWEKNFRPHVVPFVLKNQATTIPAFINKFQAGSTNYYICSDFSCQAPSNRLEFIVELTEIKR